MVAAPVVLVAGTLGGGAPASTPATTGARTVDVGITDAGCEPSTLRLPSGPATFVVTGGSGGSEYEVVRGGRVLAEAEGVAAGITGRFSLTLQPGEYTLHCPDGDGRLVVTGARAAAPEAPALAAGVDGYRAFLERQTATLVRRTRALDAALAGGDVAAARRAYAAARAPYERIEPVAESFGDLDPQIDARANDVPRAHWTGFHPIERRLWVQDTTAGTHALAAELDADTRRLRRRVRTVKLEPAQIGNGANDLLGEVAKSKITGEEERYSHLDLLDFQANVTGARAAFDAIRPALDARDRPLAGEIEQRFGSVESALRPHRAAGGGFEPFTELTRPDVRRLAQVIDALAEPLSQVPARALTG